MSDQRVRYAFDEGFAAARKKGTRSIRRAGLVLLAIEITIVVTMVGNLAFTDGAPGIADLVVATIFGVVTALFIGPIIVVVMFRAPVLEWFRIAPIWRRAARHRPTRVLHGVLLPEAVRAEGSVLRTVQVHTEDVLPVLRLAFVEGVGERLEGPVALELFAGDRVAGPVRVSVADRAEWAYHVVVGTAELESPSVEIEVELDGPLTSPTLESYSITVDQPSRGGALLAPKGDGFARARQAALGRWRRWGKNLLPGLVLLLLPGLAITLLVLEVVDGISDEGLSGTLGQYDLWQLALMAVILLLFPLIGYLRIHHRLARLRRVLPAWRRAARHRPTFAVHGVMLPGTRPVGRYGARTVLLDGPEPRRVVDLLFVWEEGWGERLTGPVVVELFAGELLRGPARVLDGRRAEWAFATRDDDPDLGRWHRQETDWDDGGWTVLDADGSGDGGDGGGSDGGGGDGGGGGGGG